MYFQYLMSHRHFTLIGCTSLTREICWCTARSPHRIDLDFFPLNAHRDPAALRAVIQEKIDAASRAPFEAVLLCFGLCGNIAAGLSARSLPLVIPRAHDCCTIFLGGTGPFTRYFRRDPSMGFSTRGYGERAGEGDLFRCEDEPPGPGEEHRRLMEKYGEENGRYLWETLHKKEQHAGSRYFIDIRRTTPAGHARDFCETARRRGLEVRRIPGSVRLVHKLVSGTWDPREFLTVSPGRRIRAEYDWDRVMEEK